MLGGKVPGGKIRSTVCGHSADLCQSHVDLDVGLEVHANDRDAAIGLRLDVLDIVYSGRHRSLEDGDHPLFHLFRREALVVPNHADDRDIDIRKDIHGHSNDGGSAENGDEHSHNHESVGAPQRESYDPHTVKNGTCTLNRGEPDLINKMTMRPVWMLPSWGCAARYVREMLTLVTEAGGKAMHERGTRGMDLARPGFDFARIFKSVVRVHTRLRQGSLTVADDSSGASHSDFRFTRLVDTRIGDREGQLLFHERRRAVETRQRTGRITSRV